MNIYEGNKGFSDLKEYFNLNKIGIVIDIDNEKDIVVGSSTLIDSISDFYMAKEWENEITTTPKFFRFLEDLKNCSLNEMILAFGDQWTDETTVIANNFAIDPEINRMKGAIFSSIGLEGLLVKYGMDIR